MPVVVLASASPRRRTLLEALGYEVQVRPPCVDESALPGEAPEALALRLARLKASAAPAGEQPVVAADTVVAAAGEVFGKPADDDEARATLARLSGRTHLVWSGWCVRRGERVLAGVVGTRVTFRILSEAEIEAYVATGEPRDKAGAYGIQGLGGALVDRVEGSYPNVVGLPVREVVDALRALGAGPGPLTSSLPSGGGEGSA